MTDRKMKGIEEIEQRIKKIKKNLNKAKKQEKRIRKKIMQLREELSAEEDNEYKTLVKRVKENIRRMSLSKEEVTESSSNMADKKKEEMTWQTKHGKEQ